MHSIMQMRRSCATITAMRWMHTSSRLALAANSTARAASAAATTLAPQAAAAAITGSVAAASTVAAPALAHSKHALLTVGPHDSDMRLDRWLRLQKVRAPISMIEKLCRSKHIQLAPQVVAQPIAASAAPATTQPHTKLSGRYRVQVGQQLRIPAWLLTNTNERGGAFPSAAGAASESSSSERASMTPSEIRALRGRILFEDASILVLNKPPGLPVHGGTALQRSRNLSAMLWALETPSTAATAAAPAAAAPVSASPPSSSSLRLVHRLDKETSGCLMLAKDRHTAELLSDLLAAPAHQGGGAPGSEATTSADLPVYSRAVWNDADDDDAAATNEGAASIQKRYLAIVHGKPSQTEGCLISASETGSLCHSSYRVLASSPAASSSASSSASTSTSHSTFSLLELIPHTGRKRQLRLHCHMELGCTIVGEQLHMLGIGSAPPSSPSSSSSTAAAASSTSTVAERARNARDDEIRRLLGWSASSSSKNGPVLPLCLHAHSLHLNHPALNAGQPINVQAPLPPSFATLCSKMFGWTQPPPPPTPSKQLHSTNK